ncbi:MAG TPA: hypothetical protein VEG33_05485 [Streptosporangiaceae bacterium]|nr:hypothetical protein [Streptosporangiaceae bacterium]
MRQFWLAAAMAVALGACARGMHRGDGSLPTLQVRNLGPAAVELHVILGVSAAGDTIGFALGTVYAGTTECFRLQAGTTPQQLKLHSSNGTTYTPTFLSGTRDAWRLELKGYASTDRLALEPADERCTPGERSPAL